MLSLCVWLIDLIHYLNLQISQTSAILKVYSICMTSFQFLFVSRDWPPGQMHQCYLQISGWIQNCKNDIDLLLQRMFSTHTVCLLSSIWTSQYLFSLCYHLNIHLDGFQDSNPIWSSHPNPLVITPEKNYMYLWFCCPWEPYQWQCLCAGLTTLSHMLLS